MNNYNKIILLHAVDKSTVFLSKFEEEFRGYYHSFNSENDSIHKAKELIADLEPKSLIIYLGHGNSSKLYEPDERGEYKKNFLDATKANFLFEDHDIFLLSCRSNDFIKKIYNSNYSIGFGNIISSKEELDHENRYNDIKKVLTEEEISQFNQIYVNCSIKIIKKLVKEKIIFQDIPKCFRYYINKEINKILLNKANNNRVELARLLFEFRNQIGFKFNPKY
ncbi:hypothetical protein FHR24_002079 [Wenyingzhuangia heitensis]|uniref:CHAT domain-containing protein n=1 Tax=Wenyingzhuangia heitensis TaxID=1487859 RepID=A0ABX0UDR9_9FLAO|nr:hypothetical protein [Wenyingzhuangia heitensis]NIJ45611.1 hypothetical protein [Wenyingzhuangia heitensis]